MSSSESDVHLACKEDRLQDVKVLIEADEGCPDFIDKYLQTPLHVACDYNRLDIVRYLTLEKDCTTYVNRKDKSGQTPLHIACKRGYYNIVVVLLETDKCILDTRDYNGQTPLHIACSNGFSRIVLILVRTLDFDSLDVLNEDHNKMSPIDLSCKHGHTDISKYLVSKIPIAKMDTVLYSATRRDRFLTVKTVFEVHRSNHFRTMHAPTVLKIAYENGNVILIKLLIDKHRCHLTNDLANNVEDNLLLSACKHGHSDMVRYLINEHHYFNGLNVTDDGENPLEIVCAKGHVDLAHFFINHQYYRDLKDEEKFSALRHLNGEDACDILYYSCETGYLELLKATFYYNPRVEEALLDNCRPPLIEHACKYGHGDIIEYLVQRCGPYISVADNRRAALFAATHGAIQIFKVLTKSKTIELCEYAKLVCIHGDTEVYTEIMQYFICECGYNPHLAVDRELQYLVHFASEYGNVNILKFLLHEHKCNPSATNKYKQTPLHLACRNNCLDVVQCLVQEQNCNPQALDVDGNSCLHFACKGNGYKTVHYLLTEVNCDPNIENEKGEIPLHLTHSVSIITELIKHGSNITPRVFLLTNALDLVKLFVSNNPNREVYPGSTSLHVACKLDKPLIAHFLLAEAKCNPNLVNDCGETPISMTTNFEITKDLIKYGAKALHLYGRLHKLSGSPNKPLKPLVKIFVIGNPTVGKSTLVAALKKEVPFIGRFMSSRILNVEEKTSGVIPHDYKSRTYGRVSFYDFAGHKEYHDSHAALVENSIYSTSSIFLIVIDLSKSDEDIQSNVLYWFSFLDNQFHSGSCRPHVILVGSHADILLSRSEDPKEKAIKLATLCRYEHFNVVGTVALDCRYSYSSGINELRKCLEKFCKFVRTQERLNLNAHCFYAFLINNFKEDAAVSLQTIQEKIQSHQCHSETLIFLPESLNELQAVCRELSDRGHLLFMEHNYISESWIIIDKVALLSHVNGTMFAPVGFKMHRQLSSCTGVVPLSKIASIFSNYDPKMLSKFMSHFEFCHEINDQETLKLINEQYSDMSQEEAYFLFPHLIILNAPEKVWKPNRHLNNSFGWILECTHPEHFLNSRFLHVLMLRLLFAFPLSKSPEEAEKSTPAIQRECSVWKNGLFWGSSSGMEFLVEVQSDNKAVIFLMRSQNCCLVQASMVTSQVIRKIHQCVRKFCPKISVHMKEYIMAPNEAGIYPVQNVSKLGHFSIRSVAKAALNPKSGVFVVSGEESLPLDDLLFCEPYTEISVRSIRMLYDKSNCMIAVSNQFLNGLVQEMSRKPKVFMSMFGSDREQSMDLVTAHDLLRCLKAHDSELTYQRLREKLDQYSLFAERDILVRNEGIANK